MGEIDMKNRNSGFTLVELLIVVFLIGIVAAIGASSWNRYVQNTNFRAAARDIEADIQQMKELKINNHNLAHTITFDVGSNNYTKAGIVNETKSPASFGPSIILSALNLGGGTTITFTDRGLLSPSTGSIVLKKTDRNSTATITFSATGRTYVTFNMQ